MKFPKLKKFDLPVDYTKLSSTDRRLVREQYVREQGGVCAFCKGLLSSKAFPFKTAKPLNMSLFPRGFLDHPVHLHHDHKTGMTIGAVHAYCNGYLWQYLGE